MPEDRCPARVLHRAHGESFPSDTAAPPSRRLRVGRTSPSSCSLVAAAVAMASMLTFYYLLTAVAGSVHYRTRPHVFGGHFRPSTHPEPGAPPRPESKFRAHGGPSMRMRDSSGTALSSQEGKGLPGLRTLQFHPRPNYSEIGVSGGV